MKRGVFVDGLTEKVITNGQEAYEVGMSISFHTCLLTTKDLVHRFYLKHG